MSAFASLRLSIPSSAHESLRIPAYAALALMFALALQLMLPDAPLPETAGRVPHVMTTLPQGTAIASDAILAHPIFAPDRRPDPNDRIGPAASGDLVLLALAQSGGRSVALVRGGDGEVHRVLEGQEIDGWKFVSIADGGAVLERNGLTRSLPVVPGEPVAISTPAPVANPADSTDTDSEDQ